MQAHLMGKRKKEDSILIVRYKIAADSTARFMDWQRSMDDYIQTFDGFISRTILHPGPHNDYYIVIRFDSEENARKWMRSPDRTKMFFNSETTWMSEKQELSRPWNTFWHKSFHQSKKWKQWIVTFVTVYPLTILTPTLVAQLSEKLPLPLLQGILSAVMISGLMTFLLMPYMLKVFSSWLNR